MAKRPTLADLTSLTNSSAINTLSQNWDAIEEAFDNTLSLDGSTPNAMNADLDLNGNGLLNVGAIDVENLTLNGQTVTDLATVPEWRGAWVTATNYAKNDLVKTSGNAYICLVAHTSGTFATDLTALKWELMVSKGDSGAGTGDLVSTNNLSDLANVTTARANLGLGTVAVESTVPVVKGGTGATDATTARTNLSAQTSNSNLTDISGVSATKGLILVGNGSNWVSLGVGADGLVLKADSAEATGVKWTTHSPSTSEVLSAIASATAGNVGTYVLAKRTGTTTNVSFGGTVSGSTLLPVSTATGGDGIWNTNGSGESLTGSALSGTWQCMGHYDHQWTVSSPTWFGATLWLRVS